MALDDWDEPEVSKSVGPPETPKVNSLEEKLRKISSMSTAFDVSSATPFGDVSSSSASAIPGWMDEGNAALASKKASSSVGGGDEWATPVVDNQMKGFVGEAKFVADGAMDLHLWSAENIDAFFAHHGFKSEVDYVKAAELDLSIVQNRNSLPPITIFASKLGLRMLELIKAQRQALEKASTGNGNRGSTFGTETSSRGRFFESDGDNNSNSGNGFGSGGGRGRGRGRGRGGGGGGGGDRTCFKCGELGHMSRECPSGDGNGGGRGGRGSNGGFGRGGRGGRGGQSSSGSSGWGGGNSQNNNDNWGDTWGGSSSNKKADDDNWDDVDVGSKTKNDGWGTEAAGKQDSWGAGGGKKDDWSTDNGGGWGAGEKRASSDDWGTGTGGKQAKGDSWDDPPAPKQQFGSGSTSTSNSWNKPASAPSTANEESWD